MNNDNQSLYVQVEWNKIQIKYLNQKYIAIGGLDGLVLC